MNLRGCSRIVTESSPETRYGREVTEALARVWEAGDRMCGKLLVAILPDLLGSLERHEELHLASREGEALLSMSAATIDRRLRGISGDRSVLDLFAPVTRHETLEASATPRRTGLATAQ